MQKERPDPVIYFDEVEITVEPELDDETTSPEATSLKNINHPYLGGPL
jgi:hypothetical protein